MYFTRCMFDSVDTRYMLILFYSVGLQLLSAGRGGGDICHLSHPGGRELWDQGRSPAVARSHADQGPQADLPERGHLLPCAATDTV